MRLEDFSHNQRVVAKYLARGMKPKAIAALMQIKPGSVNKHIELIYRKLGVTCINEFFVAWAQVVHGGGQ